MATSHQSLYDRALGQRRQVHFVARGADILEGLAEIALALPPACLHRTPLRPSLRLAREIYSSPFLLLRSDTSGPVARLRRGRTRCADMWATSYDAGRALTSERMR